MTDDAAHNARWRVTADFNGVRLDAALATLMPTHSRSRITQWIKRGEVLLNGAPAKPSEKVWIDSEIVVTAQTQIQTEDAPEEIALDVIYADDHILVINKPVGLVVHPGAGNRDGTLLNALLHFAPQVSLVARAGIVHRLDKDTSGLMVVAKTEVAQTALVRQLQSRTVTREYVALVHGDLPAAQIVEGNIGRHPTLRTKMTVLESGGKPAVTHIKPLVHFEKHTLVCCKLETGRTHQIRVHLSYIGFPLVGDSVYGKKRSSPPFPRQALHAQALEIIHPTTEKAMRWEAPMPADLEALLESLEGGE